MGFLVFAAFIAIPLIEIGLFIEVGGAIGVWPTIAVVVLTAIAGTGLLRHQGLGALSRMQAGVEHGEVPLGPVFDGFCLLAAGALLLTPGFFTDAVGFLLFVPPLRRALGRFLAGRLAVQAHATQTQTRHRDPGGDIIDGEWQDITDRPGHDSRLPGGKDGGTKEGD